MLDALPGADPGLVGVHLEQSKAADVAPVASVTAEADATAVAHPHGRGRTGEPLGGLVGGLRVCRSDGEGAIIITVVAELMLVGRWYTSGNDGRYVLSCTDHQDTFLHEGVPEARVIYGGGDALEPVAYARQLWVGVLG